MSAEKPQVIAIVGPTASGKTSLSIKLAQEFSGEVISADSRQVYRGLDIGTGKVTKVEMNGIPHHLLDVADPQSIYTGADFKRDATAALEGVIQRQNLPIIAGGTFFYLDLLKNKMQAAPAGPNTSFRDSLEHYSNDQLFELLANKDPRRASNIDQQNRRRLIRALEIIHTLGSVPAVTRNESPYTWLTLGIKIEKEVLREKFKKRILKWLDQGLLEEVASIRTEISPARFQELGFEYILTAQYLDKTIEKAELLERFVQKNWQYAKQQLTWLKKDPEVIWINPQDTDSISTLVSEFIDDK